MIEENRIDKVDSTGLKRNLLRRAFRRAGAKQVPEELLGEVVVRYYEPTRYYHWFEHIDDCLALLWRVDTHPNVSPYELWNATLAIWYHDVIYDPTRSDNEDESVKLFVEHAKACGLSKTRTDLIVGGILATKHSGIPKSKLDRLVVDIDLSILGSDEESFREYERRIREEYGFVSDEIWIPARINILQGFLNRDRIYSQFLCDRELKARENLTASIARLERGEILT